MKPDRSHPPLKFFPIGSLLLASMLISWAFFLVDPSMQGIVTASSVQRVEGETFSQINVEPMCQSAVVPSTDLPQVTTLVQPVHFSRPAVIIRIGFPSTGSSVADQSSVQIGEQNAYSPEMIDATLSSKMPLTFDATSGMAYTQYFHYPVSPSKSYLVKIQSLNADALQRCDVLLGGYYEKAQTSITGIEVYSDGQRIDPYGYVKTGATLKIVVRVSAPNVHWSNLKADLSYRIRNSNSILTDWITAAVDFVSSPGTLQAQWVPTSYGTGDFYDLRIEVRDSNGKKVVWQELSEFQVVPHDASFRIGTTISLDHRNSKNISALSTVIMPVFFNRFDTKGVASSQAQKFLELHPTVYTSGGQPGLLMFVCASSREWCTPAGEALMVQRGEELKLLAYPLTVSLEDLPSKWTLTMSVRLQGEEWITLPPPVWSPELAPEYSWVKWIIPRTSELGPYEVRFEAINSDWSGTADYVIKEAFTVVDDQVINLEWGNDIAYVDRTHQSAIPPVIEANPPPVDYSIAYIDSALIHIVPKSNISQSKWSMVTFSEISDFRVDLNEDALALADIDGDGQPEIIRALGTEVLEVRTASGKLLWNYILPSAPDQMRIEDINSDGKPEILVTTAIVGESVYGRVVVLDHAGNLKWQNKVLSIAHGIAVWHPGSGEPSRVIVGTCANLLYVFSPEGILLDQKEIIVGEWSSIDTVVVGDVDGDGQDEFVLGVWRMDRVDLWVLAPTLETKWSLTLDSLGLRSLGLGALTIFDGITLTPAPNGGQFIWVVTSPLYYNTVVDPVLFQIDGRSATVLANYHLNEYVPVIGATDITKLIRVRNAYWKNIEVSSEILVEVSGKLLVFGIDGLKGIISPLDAEILNSSPIGEQADDDALIAISYLNNATGEYGVKILANIQLHTVVSPRFPYDPNTMQGRLVVTLTDWIGLEHTRIVDLSSYNPKPILISIRPNRLEVGSGSVILTLKGARFVKNSAVRWGETDWISTTFVSNTELMAVIPDAKLTSAGAFEVSVFSPGGGFSNKKYFTIK